MERQSDRERSSSRARRRTGVAEIWRRRRDDGDDDSDNGVDDGDGGDGADCDDGDGGNRAKPSILRLM